MTNNFQDNEFSELGITVSSLDTKFKRLLKPFSRLIGRYTFAGDKPEIFKGVNYTHDDVPYAPCRMKTTRALKRRFIDFWQKDWRGKKSAIMMLDIDQENISPDIWATAGLRKPLFTVSNAAYGTCQIVYIMEQQVYNEEYYQIRDSMLHELMRFGVKVDHSKPELMRSPFFDPFYGKDKKRKGAENYIKRGRKQADFARVTVYEWNEYDPDDLYVKPCDLNNICWDDETREAVTTQPTYSKDDIIQMPRMEMGYNPAGSTSLFDQLREACYPMYSKKKIWGYDFVLSLAKSLGDGQSERKITDTAEGVFEWIEREFPKSHDASKAHNGKGSMWAHMRWCRERTKKQLLVDFAMKEGFSRQHASKLSKAGKIYEQFGRYFYTKNKVNDPTSYINSFHLVVPSNQDDQDDQDDKEINSVITNKHVNQPSGHANVVNLFGNMNHQEVEKPPPRSSPNGLGSG